MLVDLSIAKAYASLVARRSGAQQIFAVIGRSMNWTRAMVLRVTGATRIGERFQPSSARLADRLRQSTKLTGAGRTIAPVPQHGDEAAEEAIKILCCFSISCIAEAWARLARTIVFSSIF